MNNGLLPESCKISPMHVLIMLCMNQLRVFDMMLFHQIIMLQIMQVKILIRLQKA